MNKLFLKKEYSKILYIFPKDQQLKKDYLVFRVLKTLKPDVYELYLKKNDSIQKQGIALIQNIDLSHKVAEYSKNQDELYMKCKFNKYFNKWVPYEKTTELISSVKDL